MTQIISKKLKSVVFILSFVGASLVLPNLSITTPLGTYQSAAYEYSKAHAATAQYPPKWDKKSFEAWAYQKGVDQGISDFYNPKIKKNALGKAYQESLKQLAKNKAKFAPLRMLFLDKYVAGYEKGWWIGGH